MKLLVGVHGERVMVTDKFGQIFKKGTLARSVKDDIAQ